MTKFFIVFLSILPLRLNHALGAFIGWLLARFDNKSRRVMQKNIELCFADLNEKQRKKLLNRALIEMGKGFVEAPFVWLNTAKTNEKFVKKINGIAHLQTKQASILLAPHMGCWEIVGPVVSLNREITILYKAPKSQQHEDFLLAKRNSAIMHLASANVKGVAKLQRRLSKGGLIGILPDQDPGEEGGSMSPFFANDVRTMTLLVKLARKNNAKVLMTWAKRLDHGKGYEINIAPVQVLSTSGKLEDDVILMNQAIEELIKTCPEQYLWNYKRFQSIIDYN